MKIKYFTKKTLVAAAIAGTKRGYNRQLHPGMLLSELDPKILYPISFSMLHEHIAGEKVEPHVRVLAVINEHGSTVQIDLSLDDYNKLPEADVPDNNEASV